MNSYFLFKSIHIATVCLSISGFLLRAYWRFFRPDKLRQRYVKILPHINDTLLLLSAIALTVTLSQYPFLQHWLTAKVLLLLVYIIAGSIALKNCSSASTSAFALAIAICSFTGIVFIALRHNY